MGFKNYALSTRKPDLIDFGMLPDGTDLSWIDSNIGAAGAPYEASLSGTKNGVNLEFTIPVSSTFLRTIVFKNRTVLTEDSGDFTLVGDTLTFAEAPESDDYLLFWGWTA